MTDQDFAAQPSIVWEFPFYYVMYILVIDGNEVEKDKDIEDLVLVAQSILLVISNPLY